MILKIQQWWINKSPLVRRTFHNRKVSNCKNSHSNKVRLLKRKLKEAQAIQEHEWIRLARLENAHIQLTLLRVPRSELIRVSAYISPDMMLDIPTAIDFISVQIEAQMREQNWMKMYNKAN